MKLRILPALLALLLLALTLCPLAAVAADDEIHIACVGDSITWGSGSTDKLDSKQSNTYPQRLEAMLGEGYKVSSFAKPGASVLPDKADGTVSFGGITTVPDIMRVFEETDIDIVILMMGTNDSKLTGPNDKGPVKEGVWDNEKFGGPVNFKAKYTEFVNRLQAMDSNPFVFIMIPTPTLASGVNDKGVSGDCYRITYSVIRDDITPILREIAEEQGCGLIDQGAAFPDPTTPDGLEELKTLLVDGVHPNSKGYAIMAQTVYDTLTSSMHTLTYSAQGLDEGVSVPKGGLYFSGQEVTVKKTGGRMTKNGYANLGWSTSADGSNMMEEGTTFKIADSDITLYAVFPAEANSADSSTLIIIVAAAGAVLVIGFVVAGIVLLKRKPNNAA